MRKEFLPETAIVQEVGWIDPVGLRRYFTDPVDSGLLVYRALTAEESGQAEVLRAELEAEREAFEKAQKELVAATMRLAQEKHKPAATGPLPWTKPIELADAYPAGTLVMHEGRAWRSIRNFNIDEPGRDSKTWIVEGTAAASLEDVAAQ